MNLQKPLDYHLNALESMNIEFDAKTDLPKWRSRTEGENNETTAHTLNSTRSFKDLRSKLITKPPTCTFLPTTGVMTPKQIQTYAPNTDLQNTIVRNSFAAGSLGGTTF